MIVVIQEGVSAPDLLRSSSVIPQSLVESDPGLDWTTSGLGDYQRQESSENKREMPSMMNAGSATRPHEDWVPAPLVGGEVSVLVLPVVVL